MFKRENVQFYVGAAVGVTVGLCVGKLLSPNTSTVGNKLHSSISDTRNVRAPAHRPIGSISNDDNVSINKHKSCHSCSGSALRCRDRDFEDSTFLMAPLTKPALSDSETHINNATSIEQIKLDNMPLIYESYQIAHKKENLSQDAHFLKRSYGHKVEEEITQDATLYMHEDKISNDINYTQRYESIEYSSDSFNNTISLLSSDSNMATCNTIVDEDQVNLTSMPNESLDIKQYDEFSKCNLLSSTKIYDMSITF